MEASGFLVGPAVFKTVEGATSSLAGSIPVRLRSFHLCDSTLRATLLSLEGGLDERDRPAERGSDQKGAGFQGFAYVLEGEASFGSNRRRAKPAQLVLLGSGERFTVTDAAPRTRYLLMTGQPYGEEPVFNGPFVD